MSRVTDALSPEISVSIWIFFLPCYISYVRSVPSDADGAFDFHLGWSPSPSAHRVSHVLKAIFFFADSCPRISLEIPTESSHSTVGFSLMNYF